MLNLFTDLLNLLGNLSHLLVLVTRPVFYLKLDIVLDRLGFVGALLIPGDGMMLSCLNVVAGFVPIDISSVPASRLCEFSMFILSNRF